MIFRTQKEMFNYIWDTRPHVSQLTGQPLLPKGHFKWHWQFLHVLPKNSYPLSKFNSDNILLALPDEHEKQNDYKAFNDKYDLLRRKYYQEHYNKCFE